MRLPLLGLDVQKTHILTPLRHLVGGHLSQHPVDRGITKSKREVVIESPLGAAIYQSFPAASLALWSSPDSLSAIWPNRSNGPEDLAFSLSRSPGLNTHSSVPGL